MGAKKMLNRFLIFAGVWFTTFCPIMYGSYKSLGYVVDEKPPPAHWSSRWLEKCKKHKVELALGATLVSCLGGYGFYRWWYRNSDDLDLPENKSPSGARSRRRRPGAKPRKRPRPRPHPKKSSW